MKKVISILLLACLMFSMSVSSVFADDIDVEKIVSDIYDARLKEAGFSDFQELVNSFALSPGNGEDWYVISLRNTRKDINYKDYRDALLNYINTKEFSNPVEKQKSALVYLSINGDSANIPEVADETIGKLGIMSYIFGLHLLHNGAQSKNHTPDSVISEILSLEKTDGGWAIMGDYADVDTTAMVIQALSPYFSNNELAANAINRSIDILSDLQQDDGIYYSFGNPNPESGAQVMMALASIGIDALKDDRFIKNDNNILDGILTFKLDNGCFSHIAGGTYNKNSTIQVLYTLEAYKLYLTQNKSFYIFDSLSEPEYKAPVTQKENKNEISINVYLYIGVALAALIKALSLWLKGKRGFKSYLSVLIVALVFVAGISFINVQTKDQYYEKVELKEGEYITTTLSIRCDSVAGEKEFIPKNGVILDFASIKIPKDGTVYDQLIAAAKEYQIPTEDKSGYVNGIGYIYEFDFGDLSGWMFRVNGEYGETSSDSKILTDNDYVEWIYTKELGKDIGNDYQNKGGSD